MPTTLVKKLRRAKPNDSPTRRFVQERKPKVTMKSIKVQTEMGVSGGNSLRNARKRNRPGKNERKQVNQGVHSCFASNDG